MPKKDPSLDPSTTSMAYEVMRPRWSKMDNLLAGTEGMRGAGRARLPQHAAESDDAYAERLGRATLFNMTEITLDALTGRPFSDPVERSEEIPESMEALLDDIDLQGNNIDVFGREWFRGGLAKGFDAVLVDFPRTSNMAGRTIDDDRREGVRPYWVSIPAENIIAGSSEIINGRETLTHVRFREEEIRRHGFAEVAECRIRVFDLVRPGEPVVLQGHIGVPPGGFRDAETMIEDNESTMVSFRDSRVMVTIYSEDLTKKEDDPERWYVSDLFFMDIPAIPLVIYYAERDGFLLSKPPLSDLADKNIAHWQSDSDQTMILTVARFPILASSGKIDESKIKIGPHNWLNTEDPTGKWYYVEHSGAAIEAGRKELESLERQMSEYGAQFLKKRPGSETATARALDSAEATSPLQDMTIRFNDAMNTAWYFTAMWMKMADSDERGMLSVCHEFGADELDGGMLPEVGNARRARDISRKKYLAEMKRQNALSEDFDIEENETELEKEREEFADGASKIDLDPQGGDTPPVVDPDDDGGGDEG